MLQTVADPLCLSLALDIMEEVLISGDRRRYGRLMAREGALAALVRCPRSHSCAGPLCAAGSNLFAPKLHRVAFLKLQQSCRTHERALRRLAWHRRLKLDNGMPRPLQGVGTIRG